MNELEALIAEQARDARTYRVWSLSLDRMPTGPDSVQRKSRLRAHDDRHGTLACYTTLGCRCSKCRAAMAAWQRSHRAKRKPAKCSAGCGRSVGYRAGRCLSCAMKAVWARKAVPGA